jgi:hypothetical protein
MKNARLVAFGHAGLDKLMAASLAWILTIDAQCGGCSFSRLILQETRLVLQNILIWGKVLLDLRPPPGYDGNRIPGASIN